jgi:4-hydroxybenzoyl-CoA thioesterase/acyl-CoA thioester hydrolase
MPSFRFPVRVYIEDTDAGGIVYYVNYLKFMERGRTEFLRSLGYDKPAILDGGQLLVVHAAEVQYRRPARLDDQLEVVTSVAKLARTNVEMQQEVWCGNQLLCEGLIRIVCVTRDTMKPCALPSALHHQIHQYTHLD